MNVKYLFTICYTYVLKATDPCDSNPCLNQGTCINYGSYYGCNCRNGYSGLQCQIGDFYI